MMMILISAVIVTGIVSYILGKNAGYVEKLEEEMKQEDQEEKTFCVHTNHDDYINSRQAVG